MIPQTGCERCGAADPTEVMEIYTYAGAEKSGLDAYSLCFRCRRSLKRWLHRQRTRTRRGDQ